MANAQYNAKVSVSDGVNNREEGVDDINKNVCGLIASITYDIAEVHSQSRIV